MAGDIHLLNKCLRVKINHLLIIYLNGINFLIYIHIINGTGFYVFRITIDNGLSTAVKKIHFHRIATCIRIIPALACLFFTAIEGYPARRYLQLANHPVFDRVLSIICWENSSIGCITVIDH